VKVWIVLFYPGETAYSDAKIAGVFANKQEAYYQFGDSDSFYIEEHEVVAEASS
jgi:hypothetical protein